MSKSIENLFLLLYNYLNYKEMPHHDKQNPHEVFYVSSKFLSVLLLVTHIAKINLVN